MIVDFAKNDETYTKAQVEQMVSDNEKVQAQAIATFAADYAEELGNINDELEAL